MDSLTQLFFALLTAGVFLVAVEIFIPGGILGVLGSLALVGAIIVAFMRFGTGGGLIAAGGVVVVLGIFIYVWLKFFPNTPIGRALTLSKDVKGAKASSEDIPELMEQEGVTQTTLRPSGIATIAGRRVDVLAESGWIDEAKAIRVVEIEGNRIVVRELSPTTAPDKAEEEA